jgi:hypothetical protein
MDCDPTYCIIRKYLPGFETPKMAKSKSQKSKTYIAAPQKVTYFWLEPLILLIVVLVMYYILDSTTGKE